MSSFYRSLTGRGMLFIAIGVILLLSGLGLGMHDLTRIGALLLALPVVTRLITGRHPLSFDVARTPIPARVEVDQPAEVELRVTNPSRLRSPVLAAEELLEYSLGDRPRCIIPPLPRDGTFAMTYAVRSHVRGRHTLGPLALSVCDPFGLTEREVSLPGTAELIVLPRVVLLADAAHGAHGVGNEGTIPHMVALHGEDDVSVRDYRDGDDLRRVHWPATARTGALMVRQEDRPAMKRAVILLDSRESVHGPTTSPSLEWAVTMAASLVAHTDRRGYAVHLVTASPDPGIGRESTRTDTALEALALVTPGPDEDLIGVTHAAGPAIGPGGLIIAIVGSCTDDDARAIASLRPPGSSGAAVVVDRSTLAADADASAALATAEMLRRAGWQVVLVDPSTTWSHAWRALTARRATGAMS